MRIGSTIDSFPIDLPLEEREVVQLSGIMAQQFVAKISSLFRAKPTGPVDTPLECFNLTKKCLERVQNMAFSSASSLKFNHTQCRYLAGKLTMAVKNAKPIIGAFDIVESDIQIIEAVNIARPQFHQTDIKDQDNTMADCLKLLYALALEVENIITNCSRDAWTLAAVTLMDVSEHVSSIGFGLELWNFAIYDQSKTPADVEIIFQAEVEAVKGQASIDKEMLRRDIYALLQRAKLSGTEYERASLLLERLERSRLASTSDLAETPQSSLSQKVMRSMKQMERLGKGAAATVFKATWLGAEFAKKTFYGPSFPDFEKEVAILTRLSHPNIASLLCYAKDKRECSIVMELMDGDLFTLMQERLKADEARVSPFGILEGVDIMHQIGEGMRYMHDMKIVHRDLKSLNVLVKCVKALESKVEYVQVKVADFGMSRTKERSMTYSNQSANVGTTRWMAPELIRCLDFESLVDGEALIVQYPFKCDVYSFGMVCYEVLSGDIPFASISSPTMVKNMVMKGEHPELPSECHELLKNLIERCWSLDASQRPSFGDICGDLRFLKFVLLSTIPYFADYDIKPTIFTFSQLRVATQDFSERNKIGEGSFGAVYKGHLPANADPMVVKQFLTKGQQSREFLIEFLNEVALGLDIKHRNLVSLRGYCIHKDQKLLVYEYSDNNDLEHHLFCQGVNQHLNWPTRFNICLGVARGLHHLHARVQPGIIHGYISASNIWMDRNLQPKIAISELAVLIPNEKRHMTNYIAGSLRYSAPEYVVMGKLSEKADVYSYGVLLLEVVSGRKNWDFSLQSQEVIFLPDWVRELYNNSIATEVVDPALSLSKEEDLEVRRIISLALLCIQLEPERRPTMGAIVATLEGSLNLDDEGSSSIEKAMIFNEYIPGCTLKEALVQVADRRLTLSWPRRHRILRDVARGLEYLHTGGSPFSSTHCHLSPTNILLTKEYKAMISVTAYHDTAAAVVFHNAAGGTVGYRAPECSEKGFSSKSDVFSYGVVMAQLVTGRDPSDRLLVDTWGGIARWLQICVESGNDATESIDPTLRNSGYDAEILLAMKIAVLCTHQDPEQRPDCSEVFAMLREIRNPDADPADDNVSDDSPISKGISGL